MDSLLPMTRGVLIALGVRLLFACKVQGLGI